MACVLSILPGYCNDFNPTSRFSQLPPIMSSFYKSESTSYTINDLQLESQTVFRSLVATAEQSKLLEKETREQIKSKLWMKYRAGRVTASIFRQAAHSDPHFPSLSLLKKYAIQIQ